MSLLLARIDDRLVHGQVVLGCCEPLGARRILVCDADLAEDPSMQELYRLALPPGVEAIFLDPPRAARWLLDEPDLTRTILLTADAATMDGLRELGATLRRVNLGGVHGRERGRQCWPGFFLDREDREAVRRLLGAGVEVFVQTVHGAPATRVEAAHLGADPPC